jgi:hypothetical protein
MQPNNKIVNIYYHNKQTNKQTKNRNNNQYIKKYISNVFESPYFFNG